MATLKLIRKRITSVRNTQKITKAMKMVAAAKLRRAQMAVIAARPYANRLRDLIRWTASRGDLADFPLFGENPEPRRASFLVFTSNRGLCGGFNSNLLRKIETHFRTSFSHYELIDLKIVGKKGRDFYKTHKRNPSDIFLDYADSLPFAEAEKIARQMMEGFLAAAFDEYYLVYNRFKSALSQEVEIQKILPVMVELPKKEEGELKSLVDYIYEPSKGEVLEGLVPKYLATQLYRAHLESQASELGSRMTAMDNATRNAKDMIGGLTLQYNRLRQAAITKELMDIVNGAEALK